MTLPPLPTQRRIVSILEKAEETKKLRAQADELTDRLLQSVFLEMFGDPIINNKNWEIKTIEDLSSEIVDCPHSTPNYIDCVTDFPCIRTTELKEGYIDWKKMKYLDEEEYNKRVKRLIPVRDDVIYGREGSFGEAVRVPDNTKISLGQRVMLFRPKSGLCVKDGSKTATFHVDVDENIKEGDFPAKLDITYKDENDDNATYRTKTLDLILPIRPAPYLIVGYVKTTPENLMPGGKAQIKINVKNAGNKKAESVSLRVFKDASQPFEFNEKSDFVGKLEPGESGDAILGFTVDENAPEKKYLLDVELRGIDEKNNVVIFRRTVALAVNPKQKGLPSVGLIGGIVAIIGAVTVMYYSKNRRRFLNSRQC